MCSKYLPDAGLERCFKLVDFDWVFILPATGQVVVDLKKLEVERSLKWLI